MSARIRPKEDQALVFEAQLQRGKWTATIAGQVPPEVKEACVAWQSQEKDPPVEPPVKGNNGR